jgi:hypothetical protein
MEPFNIHLMLHGLPMSSCLCYAALMNLVLRLVEILCQSLNPFIFPSHSPAWSAGRFCMCPTIGDTGQCIHCHISCMLQSVLHWLSVSEQTVHASCRLS